MAIYHLEAKVVSRGAGRSAVAASAYLSCSRLYNDYDGIQHDYTKKQGLVWQEVFLPEYAPQEWKDREQLWNAVEEVETAKDSRLAREFVVALPIELSREEQIELLQEFIREQFVSDGMCADAAIHDTDGHNPHAHILLTVQMCIRDRLLYQPSLASSRAAFFFLGFVLFSRRITASLPMVCSSASYSSMNSRSRRVRP